MTPVGDWQTVAGFAKFATVPGRGLNRKRLNWDNCRSSRRVRQTRVQETSAQFGDSPPFITTPHSRATSESLRKSEMLSFSRNGICNLMPVPAASGINARSSYQSTFEGIWVKVPLSERASLPVRFNRPHLHDRPNRESFDGRGFSAYFRIGP